MASGMGNQKDSHNAIQSIGTITLRVVLAYAVFAGLWIILSDSVVAWLFKDPDDIVAVGTIKGWLFVAVTTLLLFGYLRRLLKTELDASSRELEAQTEKMRIQQLLTTIAESAQEVMFAKDLQGRYLLFNREAARITGKPIEEVLGRDDTAVFGPEYAESIIASDRRMIADKHFETFDETLLTADGECTYRVTKGPLFDSEGQVTGIFGTFRDITDLKRAEDGLRRANRALRALGECNQICARATDEAELFKDVCRVVVEICSYRMVWAGIAEGDMTVRPVALAGFDDGYLEKAHLSWADNDFGRGPTGVAIRERRPVIARRILTDPAFAPWRDEAVRRGYASSIALPLLLDSEVCMGALCVYAAEADAFDEEESQFLAKLASDLAFGVRALQDRTTRKKSEEALRDQERRLAEAQRIAHVGSWEFDLTTHQFAGTEEIYRLFGVTPESFVPTFAAFMQLIHADDRAAVQTWINNCVSGNNPADREFRVIHADGSLRHLSGRGALERNAESKPVRLVGTVEDITERKKSEEQLRKLSLAVEQSPEAIVITNTKAEIEYVNDAFLRGTGYQQEEVIGQNPRMLHSGRTPKETHLDMWSVLSQGQPWKGEFYNKRKDGSEYIEFAIITPLRQPDGSVSHYVAVKEDITEKKRIGEELDAHRHHLEDLIEKRTAELVAARELADTASQAKSSFLANMSHEIRTPMNAIIGLTHLMQRSGASPEQSVRLDKIDSAGRHLLSIINNVLDLSKIEAGRLQLDGIDFPLSAVLDNVASIIGESAQSKGLRIELDHDAVPLWLRGDPTRLRQALLNYAANAVKFTDAGTISLRALLLRETGDSLLVRFEVEDTGPGISAVQFERLFQAFEQADASITRRYGGTGLGLIITRRLAELMGGEVGADSEPGQGSTFWFTARLQRGHGLMPTESDANLERIEARLRRLHSAARILLAEDHPINREVALELLHGAGLMVDTAVDGRDALEKARVIAYDLILMDMQMPRMDGLEATRAIRALPGCEDTPILAMTANAFDEDRLACEEAGMNDFLTKPVEPNALYEALLLWLSPGKIAPGHEVATGTKHALAKPPAKSVNRLPQSLENFDGLDSERGLTALHGQTDAYLRLLQQLAASHGNDAQQVRDALANGQIDAAGHRVHALKGAAGSLGAIRVQAAAAAIERALREGAPDATLPALIDTLHQELGALGEALAQVPATGDTAAADLERARGVLVQLEPLLIRDDTEASDLFEAHRELLIASYATKGMQLRRHMDNFNYPAALAILRELLRQKGKQA
ncbi:MAG: PAS domain S-box protein [Sulfuritalea sp.]|nr:PAS domain S-box protein [Sulfuritalea sp.]